MKKAVVRNLLVINTIGIGIAITRATLEGGFSDAVLLLILFFIANINIVLIHNSIQSKLAEIQSTLADIKLEIGSSTQESEKTIR